MRQAWLLTALLLVLVAGGSYALYVFLRPAPLPEQLLYGNGHIEGTEVKVAAEIGGRIVESSLVEGNAASRGDLLVKIDDVELRLRKARADSQIEVVRHQRQRLEEQRNLWRHHLHTAESDLARYRQLHEKRIVTPQRLEQAENSFEEARVRVATMEAEVAETGARLEAARKDLALIQRNLEKTKVVSPLDGTILAKAVEPGEFVQAGQTLAVLVDLSKIKLKVFIPEKEIGKIKLGDEIRIRVDAFPERFFTGKVARVDQRAQFTPRDIHMPEERVRMVFGVTLVLDNPEGEMKPGMPADAWILWKQGAAWPERLFVPK